MSSSSWAQGSCFLVFPPAVGSVPPLSKAQGMLSWLQHPMGCVWARVATPVERGTGPSFQREGFGRVVLGAVLKQRWWSRASWWVPSCWGEGGLLTLSPLLLPQGGCRPSRPLQPGRTEQEEVL